MARSTENANGFKFKMGRRDLKIISIGDKVYLVAGEKQQQIEYNSEPQIEPFCPYCNARYRNETYFKVHLYHGHDELQRMHYQGRLNDIIQHNSCNLDQIHSRALKIYYQRKKRIDHRRKLRELREQEKQKGYEFELQEISEEQEQEYEQQQEQEQQRYQQQQYEQEQQRQQYQYEVILYDVQQQQVHNVSLLEKCKPILMKAMKYLLKVFKIDITIHLISLVIVLSLIVLMKYKDVDQTCIQQKGKYQQWESCPFGYYFLMNLQYFMFYYTFGTILFQMVMNCQQLASRKLIECVIQFIIILVVSVRTIQKQTHEIDEAIVIVYFGLSVLLFTSLSLISRHKLIIQIFKLSQVLFIVFVLAIARIVASNFENVQNVYSLLILQYLIPLVKLYILQIIKQKILMKHYYDDVLIVSTVLYITDYLFTVRLILYEDIPIDRQIIVIINFIVIQMKAILNINVFYEMFRRCLKSRLLLLTYVPLYRQVFELVKSIGTSLYGCIVTYPIVIVVKSILSALQRICKIDDREAQQQLRYTIYANGYLETRIEPEQADELSCQQQLISYFLFLMVQFLRIVIEIANSDGSNRHYWLVQQVNKQKYSKVTISNIVIANLLIGLIVFILVLFKCRRQTRILSWEVLQQNRMQRTMIWLLYLIHFIRLSHE